MCKADPTKPGVNYNKPHVPVEGSYDGVAMKSCLYCGKWMVTTNEYEFVQSEGAKVTERNSG